MLELSIQAQKGTSLIRRRRHVSLHVRLSASSFTPEIPVAPFVSLLLKNSPEFAPTLGHTEVVRENGKTVFLLSNRRGRPRESFLQQSSSRSARRGLENQEEMFHSGGSVYVLPSTLETFPDEISELEEKPFTFGIYSKFDSFDSQGNIIHSLHPEGEGLETSLFDDFNVRRVTQLAPLRVDQVRMGFETYRPRLLGGAFGSVPEVEKRLFLEVSTNRIYLFLEEQNLAKGVELPFETSGSLAGLSDALGELDLFENFKDSLLDAL